MSLKQGGQKGGQQQTLWKLVEIHIYIHTHIHVYTTDQRMRKPQPLAEGWAEGWGFNLLHVLPRAPSVFITANCLRDFGPVRHGGGVAECSDF